MHDGMIDSMGAILPRIPAAMHMREGRSWQTVLIQFFSVNTNRDVLGGLIPFLYTLLS